MTISDPSREPMLDRAMPADAVPGSTIPEDTEAEIQLRDGTWVWAQVIGQRKDRQGRWCVGLRWYASPSVGGREGWYLLDSRYIRRPNPALLVGSPRASQPWAPTEPCVTVSRYTALITLAIRERRSMPSGRRAEDTVWSSSAMLLGPFGTP